MKHILTHSFCSRNRIMFTESSRRNDSVAMILSLITGLLLAVAAESVAEGPPTREKKIYAHYMGCYPVAAAATAYHRSADAHQVRHDGKRQHDAYGDRWRNWPLVPDGMKIPLEESADLEIRRALRAGIDGFAIDAWAGGENAKQVFSALIEVAEQKDYPFEVTICSATRSGGCWSITATRPSSPAAMENL